MPDTTDYLTRIRDYAQGKDPLELQRQTPAVLSELVAKASDEQLTTRPSKDKWSIGEILAHLAEDEVATAWRYRQMVEHTGLELAGFDQDLWAQMGDYAYRVPHESLALFRLLRNANLQFLAEDHARTVGMLWGPCRAWPHHDQGFGDPYGGPRCQSHRANPQDLKMTCPATGAEKFFSPPLLK